MQKNEVKSEVKLHKENYERKLSDLIKNNKLDMKLRISFIHISKFFNSTVPCETERFQNYWFRNYAALNRATQRKAKIHTLLSPTI